MKVFTKKLLLIFLVAGTFFTSARATNGNRYSRDTKAKQVEILKGAGGVIVAAVVGVGVGVVGFEVGELKDMVKAGVVGALVGVILVGYAIKFEVVELEALVGAGAAATGVVGGAMLESIIGRGGLGLIVVGVVLAVVAAVVKPRVVETAEIGALYGLAIVGMEIGIAESLSLEKISLPIGEELTRLAIGELLGGLLGGLLEVKGTKEEQRIVLGGIVLEGILWMMVAKRSSGYTSGEFGIKAILLCGILGAAEGAMIGKFICGMKRYNLLC